METKEQAYDERIAPLMAQIIGICKRRGISMLATFHVPNEEDADLHCTTCLPDEAGEFAPGVIRAHDGLMRRPGFVAMTITNTSRQPAPAAHAPGGEE